MVSEGKRVYIYGEKEALAPLVTVNTFEGAGHGVYSFLADLTDKKFALAVVSDVNWDAEMSPWKCAPVNKNEEPCTGGADKYIDTLTNKIIPDIKKDLSYEPKEIIIAGYSLAGLFSLYCLYKTDVFDSAVSASGSLWFPDFSSFCRKSDFCKTPKKVYFSLGDKEAQTKNPLLSTVYDKTSEIYSWYKDAGIDTMFELNPGNHFKDADLRLAKGIARVLD